jgi:2-amino-4-hydroxy-6-hydroxymethyldihydropteridine diphosphokinase
MDGWSRIYDGKRPRNSRLTMRTTYALALGSNQRHGRYGPPERVIAKALAKIDGKHMRLLAHSATIRSRPVGPSQRTFANAAAIVETRLDPPGLLARLERIERKLGRRKCGRRWQARVIDLDIILWSGGIWSAAGLTVPHIAFRARRFVLAPLSTLVPRWRDPLTGLTVRHLKARLDRKRPAA